MESNGKGGKRYEMVQDIKACIEHGYSVTVYGCKDPEPILEDLYYLGVDPIAEPYPETTTMGKKVKSGYIFYLDESEIEKGEPEIEKRVNQQLLNRGFSKKYLLNNRGLIGATIDEATRMFAEVPTNEETPRSQNEPPICCGKPMQGRGGTIDAISGNKHITSWSCNECGRGFDK